MDKKLPNGFICVKHHGEDFSIRVSSISGFLFVKLLSGDGVEIFLLSGHHMVINTKFDKICEMIKEAEYICTDSTISDALPLFPKLPFQRKDKLNG